MKEGPREGEGVEEGPREGEVGGGGVMHGVD